MSNARAGSILTATPASVFAGQFITLTASVNDDTPFSAITFDVAFDSRVTYVSLANGTVTPDFTFLFNDSAGFLSGFTSGDVSGPGSLFSMVFQVNVGAAAGDIAFAVVTDPDAVGVDGDRQFEASTSVTILVDSGTPVPEPASAALLAGGLMLLAARRHG